MTGFYVAVALGVVVSLAVAVTAFVVAASDRVRARGTFLPR
jgi:hypothetical protein